MTGAMPRERRERLELEVSFLRKAGVRYPCLVCGGRGHDGWSESVFEVAVQCQRCAGTGEEPDELCRRAAYGDGSAR